VTFDKLKSPGSLDRVALASLESLEGKGPTSTTTLSPEEIAARKACPSVFFGMFEGCDGE